MGRITHSTKIRELEKKYSYLIQSHYKLQKQFLKHITKETEQGENDGKYSKSNE